MSASVRVVCMSCLRSVEIISEGTKGSANLCPHCGGHIDNPSSESRSHGGDPDASTATVPPTTVDAEETIDWAKTWERGSLGCLGRFHLRERLGDGTFGQVFRAYDPRLDRDVALKLLKQTHPNERVMERFFREARAAARLDHPNIVAVHDAGFDGGRCWVAYQLVAGLPLWWYREHHRLDAHSIARIVSALAHALEHSHQMGVVHRDVKPANILIDRHGRPQLIDFGMSRRFDFDSDLTREGAILGTPAYMSPEQASGHSRQVDERSDVFSLGVVFHELLYGHRPDEKIASVKSNQTDSTNNFHNEPGTRPSWPIASGIPDGLKRICSRATAVDPAGRYATARALADQLEHWLRQQKSAGGRLISSRRPLVAFGSAALVLLIAAAASLLIGNGRPDVVDGESEPLAIAGQPEMALLTNASPVREAISFIANRESSVYHRVACPHALAIKAANQVKLDSIDEVSNGKFRPCGHCTPNTSTRDSIPPRVPGKMLHEWPPRCRFIFGCGEGAAG